MGSKKKNTSLALSAAIAVSLAAAPAFATSSSPFQMQSAKDGTLLAKAESKPESKGAESKPKDGHCGSAKTKDGHCGGDAKADKAKDGKMKDGKCGEGTCGGKSK
ncbi:MAG: hypothetical protein U1F57_09755 [bacterium]